MESDAWPDVRARVPRVLTSRRAGPWHASPVSDSGEPTLGGELKEAASERVRVIATGILDSLLLVGTVLTNYGVSWVIDQVSPKGVDLYVAYGLQVFFALSTLGVTLAFIVRDLLIAFRRVVKRGD